MLQPPSWFQQEQQENRHILEVFWQMRVQSPNRNDRAIRDIKDGFLVAAPPENMSNEEWKKTLDKAWIEVQFSKTLKNFGSSSNMFRLLRR